MVEDCCCDYETVDNLNSEVLNPLLQDLVATPFFRYFKVSHSSFLLMLTLPQQLVTLFFFYRSNCGVTARSGQTMGCVVYVIAASANVQRMSSLNLSKDRITSQVFLQII